jgi:uncharacterized membrane protein
VLNQIDKKLEETMKLRCLLLVAIILLAISSILFLGQATSNASPQNTNDSDNLKFGIFYKDNIAFSFLAPDGWVLDNQSGVNQGLPAIFYPVGQTWQNSSVIAYARARKLTTEIQTIKQHVDDTVRTFHEEGSTEYKAKFIEQYSIDNKRKFDIYYFTDDEWGNYEAAAYIIEGGYINFFVLNSRNKADFDKSIQSFKELLKSYLLISTDVKVETK